MDRSAFEGGEPQLQTEEGRFEKVCVQMALSGTNFETARNALETSYSPTDQP